MRKTAAVLFYLAFTSQLFAQTPRTVLVEHFTNSLCTICTSKNPGFYGVLDNYPQVLHIAYYPSAPYVNCFFSKQNKQENDDRTKYYNCYGATPRIVVNGTVIPASTPLIDTATLNAALELSSPIEIKVYEQMITPDSIQVIVSIKTTGVNAYTNVKLFAGVAEEPVNKTTGNGETVHHDVFRKALTMATGDTIALPALGDSVTFYFGYKVKSDWLTENIYTLALVQLFNREVLNAARSERIALPTGIKHIPEETFSVFPNPTSGKLYLTGVAINKETVCAIFDQTGRKIIEGKINSPFLDVSALSSGLYFLKLNQSMIKFIKD